jgi:hypothetical protein
MYVSPTEHNLETLYDSIDHRLIKLTGEASPTVCLLNKPLVMSMVTLLDGIIEELYNYISTERMWMEIFDYVPLNFEIQGFINSAKAYARMLSNERDTYRRVLSNYDEFLSTLDEIDREIAIRNMNRDSLL